MAELLLILLHLKYRDKLHAKIITRRRAKEDAQKPLRAQIHYKYIVIDLKMNIFPGEKAAFGRFVDT